MIDPIYIYINILSIYILYLSTVYLPPSCSLLIHHPCQATSLTSTLLSSSQHIHAARRKIISPLFSELPFTHHATIEKLLSFMLHPSIVLNYDPLHAIYMYLVSRPIMAMLHHPAPVVYQIQMAGTGGSKWPVQVELEI